MFRAGGFSVDLTHHVMHPDPMATMSRTHREIFHLVDIFQRQTADLSPGGPEPGDLRDLRRTLYGLHAILRLHFDQEEELYLTLQEG
jgi:hypothetical protein